MLCNFYSCNHTEMSMKYRVKCFEKIIGHVYRVIKIACYPVKLSTRRKSRKIEFFLNPNNLKIIIF